MSLTTLDQQTAIIIVDLQKGIVRMAGGQAVESVVQNAQRLAHAFRRQSRPVVLVNVAGAAPGRTERPRPSHPMPEDWAEIIPELDPQPSDIRVTKTTWGAFATTDLAEQLKERGVSQVVLAGIATSIGVESTARQAYELGFNVTLAVDAMADLGAEAHECSITQIFPRLGETGTTEDVITLLEQS